MWELKESIWDKQIGDSQVGFDFSGREIHFDDFQNYGSDFGWNIISFDDYKTCLVVNIATENEMPENLINHLDEEFIINGKLFSISENDHGSFDVNLIKHLSSGKMVDPSEQHETYNFNKVENNDYFAFRNEMNEMHNEVQDMRDDLEETIQLQKQQIEELEKQLVNSKSNSYEKRIEELENQVRANQLQKERTQQIEIEKNNQRIDALRRQIETTQFSIPNKDLGGTKVISFQNTSLIDDLSRKINEKTMIINSLKLDQENNERRLSEIQKNKEREAKERQEREERERLEKAEREKQEQERLERERLEKERLEKEAREKEELERQKASEKPRKEESELVSRLWTLNYGDQTLAMDFAGRAMLRDKYGLDEEGGWDADYYDFDSSVDMFLASTKSIRERDKKQTFSIGEFEYFITNNGGKWEIEKCKKGQNNYNFSSKKMKNIASSFKPEDNEFIGEYETYSSLMVNLDHFPLIHLDKFEKFLKQILSDLPFYKDCFIYSNERLYATNQSDISAYARIFFKTNSTKDDIQILLTSISLKKAMKDFIVNFQPATQGQKISYSMILTNHKKLLKFVHAQTNFELLRSNPIPSNLPKERLILDNEYNLILKFHENNLWKKLKPYALDHQGHTYYVCEIDPDSLDINFS